MDRTGIIVVTLCAILFVAWFVEEQKYQSHLPPPQLVTNTVAAAQSQAANPPATASVPVATPWFGLDTNAPEHLIVITNTNARYTFTSRGGGLQSIRLTKYPDSVSLRWKNEMATNGVATLNAHAPAPVLAILGDPSLVGDGNFILTNIADGVRAEKVLPDGLRLVKEFHVSSNYLMNADVRLENASDKPLALPAQEWVVGTATPMGPDDNGLYLGAMWYNGRRIARCPISAPTRPLCSLFPGCLKRLLRRARATSSGRRRTINFSH